MTSVFIKLLNMSITAGWLILAVMLLRLIFRKLPKRIICILWMLAGIRLVFPFAPESQFSLIPSFDFVPQDIVETDNYPSHYFFESVQYDTGMPTYLNGHKVDSAAGGTNEGGNNNAINVSEPINESVSINSNNERNQDESITAYGNADNRYSDNANKNTASVRNEVYKTEAVNTLIIGITWAWLAGVLILLIYATVSYIRLSKKVSISVKLQDNVYICDHVKSPFILGVIKPKIYLPSSMDDSATGYVLAHERTHIARLDYILKPLGFVLLAVYWFNPLVWAAYVLLCRDIEYACDEKVIADMTLEERKNYSRTLLDYSFKKSVTVCPVAFGETGVKSRIKSVLDYKRPSFWVTIVAIAVCIAMSACFLTDPKTKINHSKTIASEAESNSHADLANKADSENNYGTNTDCKEVSVLVNDYSIYLSVPKMHLHWNNHADKSLKISPDYRLYLLENGKKELVAENRFFDESDLIIEKPSDKYEVIKVLDYSFDKAAFKEPNGKYALEQSFTLEGDSKTYTMSAEFTENSHIWDNIEWIPILSDDFDNDGKNESFKYVKLRFFYNYQNKKYECSNQEGLYTLAYFDDNGDILQIKNTSIFHIDATAYYIVYNGNTKYFLEYNPYGNNGVCTYYYYLYDMNFNIAEQDRITMDYDPLRYSSTEQEIKRFAQNINSYLKNAKLLLSTFNMREGVIGPKQPVLKEQNKGIYIPEFE